MRTRRCLLIIAVASLLAAASSPAALAQAVPTVAAASDLKFALEEIAARFRAYTKHDVKLAFGSSGNFTPQFMQGAPFEMFLSADEDYVLRLADAGMTLDQRRALCRRPDRHHRAARTRRSRRMQLRRPAGGAGGGRDTEVRDRQSGARALRPRAPRRRCDTPGLWEAIQRRLVLGENVSQAAQFATRARRRAASSPIRLRSRPRCPRSGRFALIPEDWHEPLRQRMVLLKRAGADGERFYAYVQRACSARHHAPVRLRPAGRGSLSPTAVDWTALWLSLRLGALTVLLLLPSASGRAAGSPTATFAARAVVEALVALPLVLPPTVLGYYLLVAFGGGVADRQSAGTALFGRSLVFTFEGLLVASVIFNLPFAIQPMQRGFEAIPPEVREAAACCGMSPWRVLLADRAAAGLARHRSRRWC